ncbi:MAG: cofactor-independent phosphoglycerate mutase, partial [Methanobacteriaceae archaeon]
MKYIVLIGDGMSDYPLDELNGKTPLEVANKPNIDEITKKGAAGLLKTVPDNLEPGSDVCNMGIMGYDPSKYYTGRGPLEAGSLGIKLKENDVTFRCNLITEKNGILKDFSAGHISSNEAKTLINYLNDNLLNELNNSIISSANDNVGNNSDDNIVDSINKKYNIRVNRSTNKLLNKDLVKFYPGVSYRHLFVVEDSELAKLKTTPPHDIVGAKVEDYMDFARDENVVSEKGQVIHDLMFKSHELLSKHAINISRSDNRKNPANMIWLWGQGLRPSLDNFHELYGINGSTITGVDLIKGIGAFAGLNNIDVPGATGYFDTDYKAKGKYAINALEDNDIIFIHVESPDEAGHAGNIEEKIKGIEKIDSNILGPLMNNITRYNDYKIAVLPDHST